MKKTQTFESAMKKIEEIVNKLESGDESLESSLKLFKEGTELSSYCYKVLSDAQQEIIELSEIENLDSKKDEE